MRRLTRTFLDFLQGLTRKTAAAKRKPILKKRSRLLMEVLEDRWVPTTGFGDPLPGVISGVAYLDSNGNGARDTGEIAMPGTVIRLTGTTSGGDAVNFTSTTDDSGVFRFIGLEQGTYALSNEGATNFLSGTPGQGGIGGSVTGQKISNILLDAGQTGANFNFGFKGLSASGVSLRNFLATSTFANSVVLPTRGSGQTVVDGSVDPASAQAFPSAAASAIGGSVYVDANQNTDREGTENGVPNAIVTLSGYDDTGKFVTFTQTTVANANLLIAGNFNFTNLRPGVYTLTVTSLDPAFRFTTPRVDANNGVSDHNNQITNIVLGAGQLPSAYHFGVTASTLGGAGLSAELANDTGIAGINGSATDGITSDPTIQGTFITGGNITSLRAGFDATPQANFIDIASNLNGSRFVLNQAVLNQIAGGNLGDGAHTLHLVGTDSLGNTFTKDVSFTLDTVDPLAPSLSLSAADDLGAADHRRTNNSNVTLEGNTSSNTLVQLIKAGTVQGTTTSDGSGHFSFSNVALTNGVNDYTVVASDDAGNKSRLVTFIVKNQGPTTTNSISTVTLNASTTTASIDLAANFTDGDFTNSIVRLNTNLGSIDVELFDTQTPQTVANYFNYINSGRYDDTVFHRAPANFVVQGGGYEFVSNGTAPTHIDTFGKVANEFNASRSNLAGTLAMAKVGGDANSATSEFFFNINNNASNLDSQNGGFTVFARVKDGGDQRIVNTIAQLPKPLRADSNVNENDTFKDVPLQDYNYTGNFPTGTTKDNYAFIDNIDVIRRTETLTYTVLSNSNPEFVTASIVDNRLTLTRVGAGSSVIVIRATDQSGAFVDSVPFTVNITT